MNIKHLIVAACTLCIISTSVYSDEVAESIEEGKSYYQEGNYGAAMSSFNYVVQLLAQKAAEALGNYLPPEGDGWTRGEIQTESAGFSLFGGGTSAKAQYTSDGSSVSISIAANSPMLQSVMMMMTNPMFLGQQKIERLAGQRAIVDFNEGNRSGTLNIPVAAVALVTVEGNNVTLEQMKELASKVNFNQLTAHVSQ